VAKLSPSPPVFCSGVDNVAARRAALLVHYHADHYPLVVRARADDSAGCTAQREHKEDFMKILLAIDDSPYSEAAVEAVASMTWPPDTTVRVLSAVEPFVPPATELWYDAGGSLERARQEITTQYEELTARRAERLQARGLKAEAVVRDGDPRSVIVDEAKDWSADLIVVGSHGRTGLARLLLGSVAQSVVSHAPCSVWIVRKKAED
jgi:nucleotide-binding universal stress UspA family protein